MTFLKLYSSIKNKVWEKIETKFFSESSKAYKILNRFKLLYYSNIQLRKTKLLIIFSIIIGSIAAIDQSILLYKLFNSYVALAFSDNIETTIKILFLNIIPIIGFIGSLYLLLRRSVGLWLIAIWSSLLTIPIFISFSEDGFLLSQNYFNYYNMSPLLSACSVKSQSIIERSGIDPQYDLFYIVNFSPYTSGIGINLVPIAFLILVFLIILQNKKIFSFKKFITFMLIIVFSTAIPFLVYNSANIIQNKRKADFFSKYYKLQTSLMQAPTLKNSLYDRCFAFSRPWFNADDNDFIKEVTCYSGREKVTFSK